MSLAALLNAPSGRDMMILTPELTHQAQRLHALHHGSAPLILANVWDASSARAVEAAGAAAIATTSVGVAEALGYLDGQDTPVPEVFDAIRRISRAVHLPVSADVEAGYGLDSYELADRLLEAGAVGLNLEDSDHGGDADLRPVKACCDYLQGLWEAGRGRGVGLVINARVDVFLRRVGPRELRFDEALRRARLYIEAGADCVFPIGLAGESAIARFVHEVGAPVNILLRPGTPSIERLADLGVARISVGGQLAHAVGNQVEKSARVLLAGESGLICEHQSKAAA